MVKPPFATLPTAFAIPTAAAGFPSIRQLAAPAFISCAVNLALACIIESAAPQAPIQSSNDIYTFWYASVLSLHVKTQLPKH